MRLDIRIKRGQKHEVINGQGSRGPQIIHMLISTRITFVLSELRLFEALAIFSGFCVKVEILGIEQSARRLRTGVSGYCDA